MNTLQKIFVGLASIALVVGMMQLYTNIQQQKTPIATKVVLQEKNEKKFYSINVEYPQFTAQKSTESALNTAIKTLIDKTVSDFIITSEKSPVFANIPSNLFIRYTVIQASSTVVSVLFTVEDMQSGAAHPDNYTLPFNYNLETNTIITLGDIMTTNTTTYLFLSSFTTQQLTEQDKKEKQNNSFFFTEGLAPKAENFDKFVINKDALTFVFDAGQVGPYVDGTQTVTIPMSSMQQYLKQ